MNFFGPQTYAIEIDSISGHDINSEIDFIVAESLLNKNLK